MQIKEFYLDLREGPQYAKNNKNVWLLESEAFKEPLKFTFAFDQSDIKSLEQYKEACEQIQQEINSKIEIINELWIKTEERLKAITDSYQHLEDLNQKYDQLLEQIKKKEDLIRDKELKENGRIWLLDRRIDMILDKFKEPKKAQVFRLETQELIAGFEPYYCTGIQLTPGDYIMIKKIDYIPQNEYAIDESSFEITQEHIEGEYIPMIQLKGSNAIDQPVAKVHINILFFQL